MKPRNTLLAALLATALSVTVWADASTPNTAVTVTFQDAEKFTDVKTSSMGSDSDREAVLTELRTYLTERLASRVPSGQKLEVIVRDVDMAGDFEPWRFEARDVRIVKDVYPPRVKLSFKVTDASGTTVKSGERSLSDLSFMSRSAFNTGDSLRYEKSLLADWIDSDFPKAKKS